jgi:hypothetical protein
MKFGGKVYDTNVVHRFAWVDNNTFRIINHEGIERLVDVRNNFKEIEFNVIPMFKESCSDEWLDENHVMYDVPSLEAKDTLGRLIRKYQAYKTIYFLENKTDPLSLYEELFTVDFRLGECKDRYISDLSFSFLHWNLMEQLESGKLSVTDIDHD